MQLCLAGNAAGREMGNRMKTHARQVYRRFNRPRRPVVGEAGHAEGTLGVRNCGELLEEIGRRNNFQPYPFNSFLAHCSPFLAPTLRGPFPD
jgi:hypothetical protein